MTHGFIQQQQPETELQDIAAKKHEQQVRIGAVSAAATADLKEGHSQPPSQGPVLGLILRVGTDTALAIQRHPESDKASSGEPWNIGLDDSTMPPVSETGSSSASVQSANQMTEDISIAQRMVSATCGSILTSLLGEYSVSTGDIDLN